MEMKHNINTTGVYYLHAYTPSLFLNTPLPALIQFSWHTVLVVFKFHYFFHVILLLSYELLISLYLLLNPCCIDVMFHFHNLYLLFFIIFFIYSLLKCLSSLQLQTCPSLLTLIPPICNSLYNTLFI